MEIAWLALLGFLLTGYFVLGGYDYGVQMLSIVLARDERDRRRVLGTVGPFFLGNEVWLVAFAGVLFGAFPFFEGTLLAGMYPLIVVLLVALVVGNAAVQLRSRWDTPSSRRFWDRLVAAGGAAPAVVWGVLIGVLLHGVPLGGAGSFVLPWSTVLDPFVVACAVSSVALFAAHGATFLVLRSSGALAQRATATARPLLIAAAVAVVLTAGVAFGVGSAAPVTNPTVAVLVVAVLVTALVLARLSLDRNRRGPAFIASCVAAALPVSLVGAAQYPYLLVSTEGPRFGLTVAQGAADAATLVLLAGFGVVLVPVVLAYQAWSWWLFRGRVDDRVPAYY